MRQRLPAHKQMIRARRPIIIRQNPRIRHPVPESIRQRIIPYFRNYIPVSTTKPPYQLSFPNQERETKRKGKVKKKTKKKLTRPQPQLQTPPTKPPRHRSPKFIFTMKPQPIPQPHAHIAAIQIIALDPCRFSDVRDGGEPVAGVHEVAAGFLRDAVFGEGGLALPVGGDGGAGSGGAGLGARAGAVAG